jgi:hypothetical protein
MLAYGSARSRIRSRGLNIAAKVCARWSGSYNGDSNRSDCNKSRNSHFRPPGFFYPERQRTEEGCEALGALPHAGQRRQGWQQLFLHEAAAAQRSLAANKQPRLNSRALPGNDGRQGTRQAKAIAPYPCDVRARVASYP